MTRNLPIRAPSQSGAGIRIDIRWPHGLHKVPSDRLYPCNPMDDHDINRNWSAEEKIDLYRQMVRIRRFELAAIKSYQCGKMGGWLFISSGQEMIAAVVRSLMRTEDHAISGPRGMGHALAAGMEMKVCMAELYGKTDGCSKGKGGAFSFFDPARGFWGCHGVAAAHVPLSAGLAYSLKYRGVPGVVFCFL